jgi:2-oxoglutarate dehydrogenase complex dehydrogenase (E1) component-like enzyme
MHLGAIDEGMQSARRALAEAARVIDEGRATGEPARVIAKEVRATVARVAEDVMMRVGHALGPAPLAKDAVHAKRVADLTLYLRQHHAERDEASLGESLVRQEHSPW